MPSFPAAGDAAPDFTLPSTSGTDVTLSALRGRNVLLAFFPLAFTSTCTAEMCDLTADFDRFTTAETEVLPISVDSIATLKEFQRKEGLRGELLSDFKREVCRRYGTLLEERFYSNRAYVLVDRDGTVRWSHLEANPGQRRENDELLEQIAAMV